MKNRLTNNKKSIVLSLALLMGSQNLMAASGVDATYKNLTLESRLYLFNAYGDKWGIDVGSDGLWFVPARPIPDTYTSPFKLRSSSLENTLVVGSNMMGKEGYVGIGTNMPNAKLDINGSLIVNGKVNITKPIEVVIAESSNKNVSYSMLLSYNNINMAKKSDVSLRLENKREDISWEVRTINDGAGFSLNKDKSGGKEFILTGTSASNVELILGNGAKNTAGQWLDASSRAYKENIENLDDQTALDAFHKLQTVTYNYKTNKDEGIVGFIAEDVPSLVAVKDRNALSALEISALLTKVVQLQDKEIKQMREDIKALKMMQK